VFVGNNHAGLRNQYPGGSGFHPSPNSHSLPDIYSNAYSAAGYTRANQYQYSYSQRYPYAHRHAVAAYRYAYSHRYPTAYGSAATAG
jgi:hypothetical protein